MGALTTLGIYAGAQELIIRSDNVKKRIKMCFVFITKNLMLETLSMQFKKKILFSLDSHNALIMFYKISGCLVSMFIRSSYLLQSVVK